MLRFPLTLYSGLACQFGLTSDKKQDGDIVGGSTFDSLGLTDKVQLVKKVAQTVQVMITCSYGVGLNF